MGIRIPVKPSWGLIVAIAGIGALLAIGYLSGNSRLAVTALTDPLKVAAGETRRFKGFIYRVTVNVDYKGEPQHLSYVVACSVSITNSAANGRSYSYGISPGMFGRRMKDGKALVVATPDACHGETTERNEVPKSFMPLMVVYDNADELGEGWGYASDDAYDSPLSELKFGSATIIKATPDEWVQSRNQQPPNVYTIENYYSAQGGLWRRAKAEGIVPNPIELGFRCMFVTQESVLDELKPYLRQVPGYVPNAYWAPINDKWYADFRASLPEDVRARTARLTKMPYREKPFDRSEASILFPDFDAGVARRDGSGLIYSGPLKHPNIQYKWQAGTAPVWEIYPVVERDTTGRWPADPAKWPDFVADLKTNGSTFIQVKDGLRRGFAKCGNRRSNAVSIQFRENPSRKNELFELGDRTNVDGAVVRRADESGASGASGPTARPSLFFFGDEFEFAASSKYINSEAP